MRSPVGSKVRGTVADRDASWLNGAASGRLCVEASLSLARVTPDPTRLGDTNADVENADVEDDGDRSRHGLTSTVTT
jgi:hypothetical protein